MKIYTLELNANAPTLQQVNVATNSDYKIGVKFTKDGVPFTPLADDITLDGVVPDGTFGDYFVYGRSSGDEPSFERKDLVVDAKGEVATKETKASFTETAINFGLWWMFPKELLELGLTKYIPDELVGTKLDITSLKFYFTQGTTEPVENPSSWVDHTQAAMGMNWERLAFYREENGKAYVYLQPNDTSWQKGAYKDVLAGYPIGKTLLVFSGDIGSTTLLFDKCVTEFEFKTGDIMYVDNQRTNITASRYYLVGLQFSAGNPLKASFKVNINTFKSQQGDIACEVVDRKSVTLEGTFEDGTDFSYELLTK